ncbi:aldehyde ferredoxin oxidoreductase family protein [Chloroflexota bacterium]
MSGLWGKILRVNLTDSEITEEDIPEEWAIKFYGGRGLAVRYLIEEVPKGADPLGPDNKLIMMTGPLTGTPSPSAGRYTAVSKSPLTGIFGMANAGGYWAASFKGNGFDGIILEGASPNPVYLFIDEGDYELKDAEHLWGKNVSETTEILHEEEGEDFEVACIGTAGENLVKYAAIMNNETRAAGRCGMGAVMGSKLLKAIVVRGTKTTPIGNVDAFRESEAKHYELLNDSFMKIAMETYGTAMMLDMMNIRGFLPHKNWQLSYMENVDKVSGQLVAEELLTDRKACFACPIKCGRVIEIKEGKYAGTKGEGMEYETLCAFGSMADLEDINAIAMANNLCNDYGLDTISCGSTIAFAMECYEKGILTKEDTGGLELTFGNIDAALELIPKIAKREGIGDLLAEGTRIVARKLGHGSEAFAIQVKGLELPGYEARGAKLMGMAYAVASRGGCHTMSCAQLPTMADMPFLVVEDSQILDPYVITPHDVGVLMSMENACAVFDCSGACKFMGCASSYEEWLLAISNVTGREFTFEDYKTLGERIYNMERVYNAMEGITRVDDTLPKRLLEEPIPEGPAKGHKAELDLDTYYELRGWDKNGIPTLEKLKELGLEDLIKYLS